MATAERRAEVVWEGDLPRGNGKFTVGIGAMGEQPVTWTSRTERSNGKTSPEEHHRRRPRLVLRDGALGCPR
jgi:lipoyl-dependent peroxiredoxin